MVRECIPLVAELEVERPGNLREQVDVDERPDDEVEDLLDHVAGEDARERRATHDCHEHEQGDERAHVRGHVVVQRDADCVRSQYLHVRRTARIRVAEDPVPAERGEHRLEPLEDAPDEDVDDGDVRDRGPQLLEPREDVDAGEAQRDEDREDPDEPGGDAQHAPPRMLDVRGDGLESGLGHERGA